MKTKIVSLLASSLLFASTVMTVVPGTNVAAQATGPTIGILQTSGVGVIQSTADGVIAGLNQAGFTDGKTATITIANAKTMCRPTPHWHRNLWMRRSI